MLSGRKFKTKHPQVVTDKLKASFETQIHEDITNWFILFIPTIVFANFNNQ